MQNEYGQLLEAIKKHAPSLDAEDFKQISEHGIDGGFNGFIYYADTVKFFDRNEQLIEDFIHDAAIDGGYDSIFEMCSASKTVHTINEFKNWCSWYVAESVAHHLNP
jgi:hypothetical protein